MRDSNENSSRRSRSIVPGVLVVVEEEDAEEEEGLE